MNIFTPPRTFLRDLPCVRRVEDDMKQTLAYFWNQKTGLCFSLAVLSGFTLAVSPLDAGAQEKPGGTPLSRPGGVGSTSQPYLLEIADGLLKTNGTPRIEATVANVADALREIYWNANIAVSPEVAKLVIFDLKLRSTRLEDALEALTVAGGNGFAWRKSDRPEFDPKTGLPPGPRSTQSVTSTRSESPLYLLYRDPGAGPSLAGRAVEAFNLRGYLDTLGKLDEKQLQENLHQLEEIVTETLGLLKQGAPGDEGRLEFRFHPGASLLIVVGPHEGIEVARKVVMALPGQPNLPLSPEERVRQLQETFRRRYGLRPGEVPLRPGEPPAPAVPPDSPSPPH